MRVPRPESSGTSANRRIYEALVGSLSDVYRRRLDELLERRDNSTITTLAWLRQSPARPNSRHMLEHIERLKAWQELDLHAPAISSHPLSCRSHPSQI
jgi:hypothetical protein